MFFTLFFIRRLLVAFATIRWANFLILEIYINVFTSLIMLKFMIDWRPFDSRTQNQLEIFNEGFTLFSNYMLIIFTEFISVETRYGIGFVIIYLILLVCALNIIGVFFDMLIALRLTYLKRKHDTAWESYHLLNNKIVSFLLRDFEMQTSYKLNQVERYV